MSSVAQWMENPLNQELQVTVTNFCADSDDCLDIAIGMSHLKFYGAGQDDVGNYIPTNYPPVVIPAILRREYNLNIVCPNSGPQGSPLFGICNDLNGNLVKNDFSTPDGFVALLTSATPDLVSAFLWSKFTGQAQSLITMLNSAGLTDDSRAVIQTNLIQQLNLIIGGGPIYNPSLFPAEILQSDTSNLLALNPQGQDLVLLNRMLLRDAYANNTESYAFPPIPTQFDDSGTAQIMFSILPPPELRIKKNQPPPEYTIMLNNDTGSGGVLNLLNPGTGNLSTNFSTIEVVKDKFSHYGLGNGCDDATKAPGQGSWLSMGPGCTADTNRISLEWHVSLGRTFDGLAAGQVAFQQDGLSPISYTPYALFYNAASTNIINQAVIVTTNIALSYETNITRGIIIPNITYSNVYVCSLTNDSGQRGTIVNADYAYVTNLAAAVVAAGSKIEFLWFTNSYVELDYSHPIFGTITNITTNTDLQLRQIMACQTFVDITAPDTNHTILSFYFPSQVATNRDQYGVFTNIIGNPFVTWTIQNPAPATTNQLNITENRQGAVTTQSLVESTTDGGASLTWTLTQGTGVETRTETRNVAFVGSPATDRVELNTISYANSGSPAYQCQETYHFYPWGSELAQTKVIPYGSAPLVTTYQYYNHDDPVNDQKNYGYTEIKEITYPDGYWEKRLYGVADAYPTPWYPYDLVNLMVLNPSIDANGHSATSPDEATPYNTLCTEICSYGHGFYWNCGLANQQYCLIADNGNLTEEDYSGQDDATDYYVPDGNSISGNISIAEKFSDISDGILWAGYQHTMNYDASVPPGMADHSGCVLSADNTWHVSYYDWGTYDTSGNMFVLNPTNHLYTDSSLVENFPDHRQSTIDSRAYSSDSGGHGLLNEIVTDYFRLGTQNDVYHNLEGHGSFLLVRGYTPKNTRIYHLGNLAQTEKYIYVSPDSTDGQNPQWALFSKNRYYFDSFGRATNVVRIDGATGQTRTLYTADYRGTSGQDGELLISETDENGQQTSYTYDSLQRVKTVTVKGFGDKPSQIATRTYDANGRITGVVVSAGSLSYRESWAFDLAGRQTNEVDQSGITTQTSYSANNQVVTTTGPGGITTIKQQYIDRSPESVQGNGCVAQFYDHTAPSPTDLVSPGSGNVRFCDCELTRIHTTYVGHANSARWTRQGDNLSGDAKGWQESPVGAGTANMLWQISEYDWPYLAWNWKATVNGNYNTTAHLYSQECMGSQVSQSTAADGGDNRVSESLTCWIAVNGIWYQATTNFTQLTDYDPTRTVVSIHLDQLNGFAGNTKACSMDFDADNNETITTTTIDRADNKVTTVTSEPNTSSLSAVSVYQNGLPISSSTLSVASPTLYFYDALGRTNLIQDPLGNLTSMFYDPSTGWLTSVTDAANHTTTYTYYNVVQANAGKLCCQTDAGGKKTYYSYTTQGKLYQTWGDVPYPAEYRYDEYGNLTNLITFRGGSGWTGLFWPNPDYSTGDNTYWNYDAASGALISKTDAQGRTVNYTYDSVTGRLATRSWARLVAGVPVTVTNYYNGFGDLTEQDYNDGTPSVLYNNYNRSAQPREIVDGAGTKILVYDFASRLVSSSYISGPLSDITVSNHFNPCFGRDALKVFSATGWSLEDDYGYDPNSGRLASVSSGNCSAAYSYMPDSDLLQSTTFRNGFSTVMTTTRTWKYGFQLASIGNYVNGVPVTSHAYVYDAVNRRTQATLEDGSSWVYGYNDRNELIQANRHWSDSTAVSGQQYGYLYDNIGNRQYAYFGGDTNGNNLQTISYTANNLNQYSGIVTPGLKDTCGAALATNSVTVNGTAADRHGEYFHRQISVANTNQPVWQNVTTVSGTFSNQGGLTFPANSQTFAYDADGNLAFDGIWNYQWDGENRLISMNMTNIAGLSTNPQGLVTNRLRLDFAYDYQGRRVQKRVSVWNSARSGFQISTANNFVYDGWNLIAVLNSPSSILQSFVWGNDLSGTMTKAGGVGGLLMASISGTNCFAGYDGNGNVIALVNSVNQSLAARYEYSPFHEVLRATGPIAILNPIRSATKYLDSESELVYYGHRYYSPNIGRFLGRDPSGINGGLNLHCFVKNNPISLIDRNGLDVITTLTDTSIDAMQDIYGEVVEHEEKSPSEEIQAGWEWTEHGIDLIESKIEKDYGVERVVDKEGNWYYIGEVEDVAGRAELAGMALTSAFTTLNTLDSVADGILAYKNGGFHGDPGTSAANAYDFVKDVAHGDSSWADLDAITLACQIGETEDQVVVSWGALSVLENAGN